MGFFSSEFLPSTNFVRAVKPETRFDAIRDRAQAEETAEALLSRVVCGFG
jgi:hypothetical protein